MKHLNGATASCWFKMQMVRLILDPARLNKVLIRLIHRDLILNDILPRLAGFKYLMLINVSSGYHSLKLDEQ